MKVRCLYDKLVPISELNLNPNNRNVHPNDQVKRLAEILDYQGWRYCVKVSNQTGMVTSGHGRVEAALLNKWKEVPVNYQDYDTPEQEYADTIADNAIASWAELNLSGINTDIQVHGPDLKIEMLGIKDFAIEPADKLDPQCEEDDVPENIDPFTKLGDCYRLGNHRLLCGDSTSIDAVEKLMNGEKADMVFTDPPYNVNYSNADRPKASKTDLGRIENDSMSSSDFLDFLRSVFSCLDIATKENSTLYMFFAGTTVPFYIAIDESNFQFNQLLIWKKPMLLGRSKYQWAHEPCLLGVKGSPYFTSDRTKTTVWDFGGYDKSKNIHPTQKPIVVPEEAVTNSSEPGNFVLDLFGGSGSTLIASEKTNRRCFMMELDPHYCDVIVARWEKYTGKKAELINET